MLRRKMTSLGRFGNQSSVWRNVIKSKPDMNDIKYTRNMSSAIPDRNNVSEEACTNRRNWLEKKRGFSLSQVGSLWKDDDKLRPDIIHKGKIENPISSILVPVGMAGPLQINGSHAYGEFMAPLATVEGGVMASVSRAVKGLNMAGGVMAFAGKPRVNRQLLITPKEALILAEWIKQAREWIQSEAVQQNSQRAKLKEIKCIQDMEDICIRFEYDSSDASGQNMVTVTTHDALHWISETAKEELPHEVQIKESWVESCGSGDKKMSSFNFAAGRGLDGWATADIPEYVLKELFHVDSRTLVKFWKKSLRTMEKTGTLGSTAHMPNAVAAFFAATGQDLGCIHEATLGHTSVDLRPQGGVRISVGLPCLIIGTVRGATDLPSQRECLEILGCYGPGKIHKLGEIIASFTLAAELSLISGLANSVEFVESRNSLGRNPNTLDTEI